MTVPAQPTRVYFTGNGSTGPFTFPMVFNTTGEIYVTKTVSGVEELLAEGTHYSVSGALSANGGSITLTSALATGEALTIQRVVPFTQPFSFRNQGAFYPETHERAFDRLEMQIQQVDGDLTATETQLRSEIYGMGLAAPLIDLGIAANLEQAVAAFGSAHGTITIATSQTLTGSLTLHENLVLRIIKPAVITVPNGATLTINSPFDCGAYQVFNCVGSGCVTFGNCKAASFPEWWGVTGTNDHVALNSALAANPTVSLVANKLYYAGGTTFIPSGRTIHGNNAQWVRKSGSGVYDMWVNSDTTGGNTGIHIIDITVDGNKDADSLVAGDASSRFCGISLVKVSASTITNLRVTRTVNGEIQAEGTKSGLCLVECDGIDIIEFTGDNNDRTALMIESSPNIYINGARVHYNLGSGVTSRNNNYNNWSNIWAHDNGYSQVSLNGTHGIVSNVYAWNGAVGFSGVNIGHPVAESYANNTVLNNINVYDNAGWGLTIYGSSDVTINGLNAMRNADRNVRVFGGAERSAIMNVTISHGVSSGILYDTGTGHFIDNAQIYNNGLNGVYLLDNVELTIGPNVCCYNNGQSLSDTTTTSCGVLADHAELHVLGGKFYDNQTPKTQDSGIFVVGGTAWIKDAYIPTNATYRIRTSDGAVIAAQNNISISKDPMFGTFTAVNNTATTVLNGNAQSINRILIYPVNASAVAKGVGSFSAVTVGVSFTVSFSTAAAGTEVYGYIIL